MANFSVTRVMDREKVVDIKKITPEDLQIMQMDTWMTYVNMYDWNYQPELFTHLVAFGLHAIWISLAIGAYFGY